MPILRTDHLLEQADGLILATRGRPRQVDLRRAISSAYYAVFHAVITAAADEIVGVVHRGTRDHALVMRSIDHRTIKTCCLEIVKTSPPRTYVPYIPTGGFSADIQAFANVFPDLQDERHAADYDSMPRYVTADAVSVVAAARGALQRLTVAAADQRRAFLFMILFPPKR